jgi:ribulose 1,5-bisphosphate synthetase/thiazole synthase
MQKHTYLHSSDIVILGGTFPGMTFALEQARAGSSVTLIESRTYLGTEITATLRPWIPVATKPYSELIAACIAATNLPARQGEYPLHLDVVKVCLEDILLEAGVHLLYGCNPMQRTIDGLIIGCKGGLREIRSERVMDARIVSRSGKGFITLEFDGAAFPAYENLCEVKGDIPVPEVPGIPGNMVHLHRGYRSSNDAYVHHHVLVEVPFMMQSFQNALELTRGYSEARSQAMSVASYLLWEHPAFRLAYLGKIAEEVYFPESDTHVIKEWIPDSSSFDVSPSTPQWDVIVVGGGTSGTIAAIAAAQEGARTLVVEMNPGMGGTGTYGGISAYWMGWQKGFCTLSMKWTDTIHDRLRYPRLSGALPVWNIEAKIQALLEQAQACGVELLFNTCVVDALVENGRVFGVIAATPLGILTLRSRVVIDATGDGDVADFAGAEYHYGSHRDGIVMWYSLAQFVNPGRFQGSFTSMVDILDPDDYTRAAIWGKRRRAYPDQVLHDHGGYVAPRETRHIHGEFTQTLSDQLLGRAYPDVIGIAISNNDMKGHTSTEWMKVGLIPPNLYIEISYRMLIPKGLDGILVVGKAISAERDALPSIRMQPDFENLGGAAGIAAAFAVRDGVSVRQVDIHKVQEYLVSLDVLPKEILNRKLTYFKPGITEIQKWIDMIIADQQPLWSSSSMEVNEYFRGALPFVALCCSGKQAIPLIEQALTRPIQSVAKRKLGRALAMMGAPSAVDVLISELEIELIGVRLPELKGEIRHTHRLAPDQAAMPEAAYLLYALGLVRNERALPVWQRVVDLLEDINLEEVTLTQSGIFAYVDAVCSGVERLANPKAIPLLEKLQDYLVYKNHQLYQGMQVDYLPERVAYLEIIIARALARCGSPRGVLTLINYLRDVRKIFARHVHGELVAISGKDYGFNPISWAEWLETTGEQIPALAWNPSLEAVSAWEEEILIQEEFHALSY